MVDILGKRKLQFSVASLGPRAIASFFPLFFPIFLCGLKPFPDQLFDRTVRFSLGRRQLINKDRIVK